MNLNNMWYWISLSYATFGIETQNDIVITTAPIGNWMKSKHINYIKNWVEKKKGIMEKLNEHT